MQVLTSAQLLDHGIILEYQIPLTSLRLDALVSGHDLRDVPNAVIVELKQWEEAQPAAGENEVLTFIGGREREVLHPSVQAGRYQTFLADIHTVFYSDAIFAAKFQHYSDTVPLFCADQVPRMKSFLKAKLDGGRGSEVLNRIEGSEYLRVAS